MAILNPLPSSVVSPIVFNRSYASSVSTRSAADRTSALNPKRSFMRSAPDSTGHMRSSASLTSGRARSRARSSRSQPSGGASPRTSAPATPTSSVLSRSNKLVTLSGTESVSRRWYERTAAAL